MAENTLTQCGQVSEDGLTGSTGRPLDLQETLKTQEASSAEGKGYQLLDCGRALGTLFHNLYGPWNPVDTH